MKIYDRCGRLWHCFATSKLKAQYFWLFFTDFSIVLAVQNPLSIKLHILYKNILNKGEHDFCLNKAYVRTSFVQINQFDIVQSHPCKVSSTRVIKPQGSTSYRGSRSAVSLRESFQERLRFRCGTQEYHRYQAEVCKTFLQHVTHILNGAIWTKSLFL